jgi:hypothetical protein
MKMPTTSSTAASRPHSSEMVSSGTDSAQLHSRPVVPIDYDRPRAAGAAVIADGVEGVETLEHVGRLDDRHQARQVLNLSDELCSAGSARPL